MAIPPVKNVLAHLTTIGTAGRRTAAEWYYPTSMTHQGVTTPKLRTYARELRDVMKNDAPESVLEFAAQLVETNSMDARQLGYCVIGLHRPAAAAINKRWIMRLGHGNDNWCTVDGFCMEVSGPAWRNRKITDATVIGWATSKDQWWQRTALASAVMLNRKLPGHSGDPDRTLMICTLLADTREPQLIKALSWAVRSIIPWDPAGAEAFLTEHDTVLPALVKREVRTKLRTGTKSGRSKSTA